MSRHTDSMRSGPAISRRRLGYMKTNGTDTNGGNLCGVVGTNCASGGWRQVYADYLVRYLRFYQEEGVRISHLGFLNEPDLGARRADAAMTGDTASRDTGHLAPRPRHAVSRRTDPEHGAYGEYHAQAGEE